MPPPFPPRPAAELLTKSPIVCPPGGPELEPEALLKLRRPRSAPKAEPATKPKKPKPAATKEGGSEETREEFEIEDEESDAAVADDQEDDIIEDTTSLAEADMSDRLVQGDEDAHGEGRRRRRRNTRAHQI